MIIIFYCIECGEYWIDGMTTQLQSWYYCTIDGIPHKQCPTYDGEE